MTDQYINDCSITYFGADGTIQDPFWDDGWYWGAVTSNTYWGLSEDMIGPEGSIHSSSVLLLLQLLCWRYMSWR